jgi:hypothetical protein
MTWLADSSPCTCLPIEDSDNVRAIGWLERDRPFATGGVPPAVYVRLSKLLRDPWQPIVAMGPHECDLCRFAAEARGTRNLFVPGDAVIFVCPELILHYMNAHGYAPPDEFCTAVLKCPDTRTMEYKRLLLASGGRCLLLASKDQLAE